MKITQDLHKKRMQFAKRRDVGEDYRWDTSPAGLIEASKETLIGEADAAPKKPEIEKIKVKAPYKSLINLNPTDSGGRHMSITREQKEILDDIFMALVEADCSDEEIIEFFSDEELLSEGVRLRALGDELGITKPSKGNAYSSRMSRLKDTLGHTAAQAGLGTLMGAAYGGVKGAAMGAAGSAAFGSYLKYRDQKKYRQRNEDKE